MSGNKKEVISKLRVLMKENGLDAYIIPSSDNHQSEYVGEFFKARAYVSGFTGDAGTVVITRDEAGLWTDGRFFLQAEYQLKGSGIKLFKMGNPGVPTVFEYLEAEMPNNGKLGFDGRLIPVQEGEELIQKLADKNVSVEYNCDLVGQIWGNRPKLANEPVFLLEEKYSGESTASKLCRLRNTMKEAGANYHVITTLDDIAWLLNIRGNDVMYSPLVLCYAVVSMEKVYLFIEESRIDAKVKESLDRDNVVLKPYNDIYEYVKSFKTEDTVLIDPDRINYALYKNIPVHTKKIKVDNPTVLFKSIKNSVELANIEKAHVKDGVAITKFMHWLKTNIGKIKITEISASQKLEEFRKMQDNYLWQSFEPICAFKEHAAMMHYTSTSETDVELTKGYFFLTDTGGNYLEGSTDITRTFVLGEVNKELKHHFTVVARSMMNLARARFLYGCKGYNLDVLAREPIWSLDIDYKCGTGHGVGYLLNIHEAPSGFRWYVVPSKHETHVLEEGMVITDEPGIYIDGSYGIRLENELIVRKGIQNEFGQFMYFDPVTYAPIDLDAIDPEDLSRDEKVYLNSYHKLVYQKLAPYLTEEEQSWLKLYTREV
ncbi:aminopeptidase P family protein [Clostridium sp. MT-14]|uniref:Aminopeptidase P family protein n=1 Tax=Clostridium aromativorans TaxID=2836848 RepID=A0ABS8N9F0_9CLOT|nr:MULTISPECIES: aminopeptidase P family protein [Clostridium]KAA8668122.1 aminopeptidase P family protein [Clostridium sp. HV4-5-A1G]MCC9295769.1 aminopeptidase P family protein [Clostridium aromativorans]CAB1246440.1 Xaa-Pro aminopeptidase [Clostridiaceae bacterium BL-3]